MLHQLFNKGYSINMPLLSFLFNPHGLSARVVERDRNIYSAVLIRLFSYDWYCCNIKANFDLC